jgi:hypothetical protein
MPARLELDLLLVDHVGITPHAARFGKVCAMNAVLEKHDPSRRWASIATKWLAHE